MALDCGFVAAWVALSLNGSLLYNNGTPLPAVADRSRAAAERALALDPKNPGGYWALGSYYRIVGAPERALEQLTRGLALAPNDPNLLRGLGLTEQALGHWDAAVEHFRRSLSLEPRSAGTLSTLADALLWLRRYDEADSAMDAAIALRPASISFAQSKAMIRLGRGDLAGARAVLAQPPAGADMPEFVAYLATYWDMYWPLGPDQRALVARLTPAAFDGDAGTWGLALAGVYEMAGDRRRAAAYADTARAALEQQLTAAPSDPQRHVLLGLALAFMGRKDAAVQEAQRGISLTGSDDATTLPYYRHQLVRVYLLVGEPERAIDVLETLLKTPYYLSPGWLRVDPTFDALRSNPRFQRLAEGTTAGRQAAASAAPAASS